MSQPAEDSDSIRRYLLGELSGDELAEVERRLLSDSDYYEQILIADDELVYDFVRNKLPEPDRLRFRQHALPVPERRRDVVFAQALRKYVDKTAQRTAPATPVVGRRTWRESLLAFGQRPRFAVSLAAALLLALSLITALTIQNRRLRSQLAAFQAGQTPKAEEGIRKQLLSEQERNAGLSAKLLDEEERRLTVEQELRAIREKQEKSAGPELVARANNSRLPTFPLTASLLRDPEGSGSTVQVRAGATAIKLNLDLGANLYRSYRVALKSVGGTSELWSSRGTLRAHVAAGKITVPVVVPTKVLSRGDYELQLSGVTSSGQFEDLDTYYFRIVQ